MARIGKVTASELDNIVKADFTLRTGDMPKTYLYKKAAEAFRGELLPNTGGSWSMEQGNLKEEEAIPWYAFAFDVKVRQVGFIESDDGRCGCSPDGLIGDDEGLEVKCPSAHVHLEYLDNDEVPKEYLPQIHMSMFVTGFKRWTFLSYARRFPAVIVKVERDEEICGKIASALDTFYGKYDAFMTKLRSFK